MTTAALIVAGGSGTRLGADRPKQYLDLGGKAVIRHTLEAFLAHPRVDMALVVIGAGHEDMFAQATRGLALPAPAGGGPTRQLSVANGLEALAALGERSPEVVMIHDAARPFVSAALVDRLLAALDEHEGVIPALPVVDTIKVVDAAGVITATPDRSSLRAAQTPQVFPLPAILAAHRRARERGETDLTDDAAVAELAGMRVAVVAGEPGNRKITSAADLEWARSRLAETEAGA